MAEPPPNPRPGATTGTQRWKVVLGVIIVISVLALMVVLHITGSAGSGVH